MGNILDLEGDRLVIAVAVGIGHPQPHGDAVIDFGVEPAAVGDDQVLSAMSVGAPDAVSSCALIPMKLASTPSQATRILPLASTVTALFC